ncbi:MAG: choice-of-anchor D domain-containing protein [Deltaproteobacteria bacterium]|nr:choice-of-anchor D domain-containing protein [Deltaproteobacteria bacterium]
MSGLTPWRLRHARPSPPALRFTPALLALTLTACSSDDPTSSCAGDSDCKSGALCQSGTCLAATALACVDTDTSRTPAISVQPTTLEFGDVGTTQVTRSVEVRNVGACTLRIGSWVLEARAESRFRCLTCESVTPPVEVPPGRAWVVELAALPGAPGNFVDTLTLRSSDPTHEYTTVALSMRSLGEPELLASPELLDFGFVSGGSASSRTLTLLNNGGVALEVTRVRLEGSDASDFDLPSLALPTTLQSARLDPSAKLEIAIGYSPVVTGAHSAQLSVEARDLPTLTVPLSSHSEPPEVDVATQSVDFGRVRVGREALRSFAVQNTGRTALALGVALLASASRDLSASPVEATVAPGSFTEIRLRYAPTTAGGASGELVITTNDPDERELRVALTGVGEAPPPGDEVVTLDLTFRTDSNSLLDTDLRDVDLLLDSPLGRVCSESERSPDWGPEGQPRWTGSSAAGSERIVLAGATQDGEYTISAQYIEDCSSLPTQLAARLLGIGSHELTEYFSDGDVTLDANRVAGVVSSLCVNRSAGSGTLDVRINGALNTFPLSLPAKGSTDSVRLIRADGRFRVTR